MSKDDLAIRAVTDLMPETKKAFEAVSDYGLKCFEAGAKMAQETAKDKPDKEKTDAS